MTPTPPSSPDGAPLPPRHRPTLGNLAKDTTELDLWAFEDDLDLPEDKEQPRFEESPRSPGKVIPVPRERQGGASVPRETEERQISKTPTGGEERIRMNVNKVRSMNRPTGATTGQATPESEFDELDNWDDTEAEPDIGELPGVVELELHESFTSATAVRVAAMPVAADPEPLPEVEPVVVEEQTRDEFSPLAKTDAQPVSLRPHMGLTKVERLGLTALSVILLAAGIAVLTYSLKRLPTDSHGKHEINFPVKGAILTIDSAATYWRTPITTGPTPETVRRDTQLLPVLELGISGGPAALRVLFRNDEGTVVGDAVTRAVRSGGKVTIPATAGFDDFGMHAAYRTGESPPWIIEIFEAPSEGASGDEYKKLLEMEISTDRR